MPMYLKQILIFCAIHFGCLRFDCRRILHRDHIAGYVFFGALLLYCSSLFCPGACIAGNVVYQGKSIENRACRALILAAYGKSVVVKGRTGTRAHVLLSGISALYPGRHKPDGFLLVRRSGQVNNQPQSAQRTQNHNGFASLTAVSSVAGWG